MDYDTVRERAAMFRGQISQSAEYCLKVYEQMEKRGFNINLGVFVDENVVPVSNSNKGDDSPKKSNDKQTGNEKESNSLKLDTKKLDGQENKHAKVSSQSSKVQPKEDIKVKENSNKNNHAVDHIKSKVDENLFGKGYTPAEQEDGISNSVNQWLNPTAGKMHFYPPGAKLPMSTKPSDDTEITKMQVYFKKELSNVFFVQCLDQYFITQKHSGDFKFLKNGVKGALMYALFNCVCEGPIQLNAKFRYYDYSGYIKNLFSDPKFLDEKKWRKHVLAMKRIMLQCGVIIKESKMLRSYGEYYPSLNFYDPPQRKQF